MITNKNANNKNNSNQTGDPLLQTVAQTLANKLKVIQNTNFPKLNISPPIISTKQGYHSINFHEDDFIKNGYQMQVSVCG